MIPTIEVDHRLSLPLCKGLEARALHKALKAAIRRLVSVDPIGIESHKVDWTLLTVACVRTHAEVTGGYPNHVVPTGYRWFRRDQDPDRADVEQRRGDVCPHVPDHVSVAGGGATRIAGDADHRQIPGCAAVG